MRKRRPSVKLTDCLKDIIKYNNAVRIEIFYCLKSPGFYPGFFINAYDFGAAA